MSASRLRATVWSFESANRILAISRLLRVLVGSELQSDLLNVPTGYQPYLDFYECQ